jgi:hypothetical protein
MQVKVHKNGVRPAFWSISRIKRRLRAAGLRFLWVLMWNWKEAAMLELKSDKLANVEYDQDLAVWYQRQADLLREGRFDQIDLENLIEELEVAVKNLRRELSSRLEVLIMHLLKCEFQHERISAGWLGTLGEQRSEIDKLLAENPSLAPGVMQVATKVFPRAARRAATATGLPQTAFPTANPYTREQLLDDSYVP